MGDQPVAHIVQHHVRRSTRQGGRGRSGPARSSTRGATTAGGPVLSASPGIGQGGVVVGAGASGASVTAIGPDNVSFVADMSGTAQRGGLRVGTYTVISSLGG